MIKRLRLGGVDTNREARKLNKVWQFKERCVGSVRPEHILFACVVHRIFRVPNDDSKHGIRFWVDLNTLKPNDHRLGDTSEAYSYARDVLRKYRQVYPKFDQNYLNYEGICDAKGNPVKGSDYVVEKGKLSDRGKY